MFSSFLKVKATTYIINPNNDKLSFTIDTILPDASFEREKIEEENIEPAVKQLCSLCRLQRDPRFNPSSLCISKGQQVKHAPSPTYHVQTSIQV